MPSFTALTKPTQGEGTKKSLADGLIDNDSYVYSELAGLRAVNVPNGSFEVDTDADTIPDRWTRTLYTGGSGGIDSTDSYHGKYSMKFTSPGGGGNGGGYLVSNEYFEVTPGENVLILWYMKSSVAGVTNAVMIQWYDKDKILIGSAEDLYRNTTSNPTSWTLKSGVKTPPSTARFAKLQIIGCENTNPTAGSTWFDNFRYYFSAAINKQEIISTPGAWTWTCPASTNRIRVRAWSAGGAATSSTHGGSSGAYAEFIIATVPGGQYSGNLGAGGASTGGSTTFITPSTATPPSITLVTLTGGAINEGTPGAASWFSGTGEVPAAERHSIDGFRGTTAFGAPAPCGGAWAFNEAGKVPGGGGQAGTPTRNGGNGLIIIEHLS